jgi:hypothetical protein
MIMACTITSLILVAMFGVIAAAGLVERASHKGSSPARQDGSPVPDSEMTPAMALGIMDHIWSIGEGAGGRCIEVRAGSWLARRGEERMLVAGRAGGIQPAGCGAKVRRDHSRADSEDEGHAVAPRKQFRPVTKGGGLALGTEPIEINGLELTTR